MSKQRLMKVLLSPLVSEKSALAADLARQYTFKVVGDATKTEIAEAVEMMFEVKVEDVRTAVVKGKNKRFGTVFGKRSDWKKAMVRLKEGHEIDFAAH